MQPIEDPMKVIGEITFGQLVFPIRKGQACSFQRMEHYKEHEAEGTIIGAYICATGDERWNIDVKDAYAALSYAFILEWFRVAGHEVPAHVTARAEDAFEVARHSTHQTNENDKPKIAYRHFILNALRAGVAEVDILKQANQFYTHVQNRKAHIIHWRNKLAAGVV